MRTGDSERRVHMVCNHGPGQQIFDDILVLPVCLNKRICCTVTAGMAFQPVFAQGLRLYRVHRQEGRPSAVAPFQIFDCAFAICGAVNDDVGGSCAKRGINSGQILRINCNQRRHRTMHTGQGSTLCRCHNRFDGTGKPFIFFLHIAQHPHAVPAVGQRCGRILYCFGEIVCFFPSAVRFERNTRQLILGTCKRL